VTRDSILIMAHQDLGIPVAEEPISVAQWKAGCESGEITEVFACGTAAVVTPVGEVKSRVGAWTVADGGAGPITMKLRNALLGVQSGQDPDTHAWMFELA
jgi:branched-chain amino acid aminotransferase